MSTNSVTSALLHDEAYLRYILSKNFGHELPLYQVSTCPAGCQCYRHPWIRSAQEAGKLSKVPSAMVGLDLQQFTTPFNIAKKIAKAVKETIGDDEGCFTDFGAGQGSVSAALLLEGYSGVGVEIDATASCFSLSQLQLPAGGKVPYSAYWMDVKTYSKRPKHVTDFTFLNPPFYKIKEFYYAAFACSSVVFGLIPDDGKALDYIIQAGKNREFETYPIESFKYTLTRTRKWQLQHTGFTDVLLICCVKKNESLGLMANLQERIGATKTMTRLSPKYFELKGFSALRNLDCSAYGATSVQCQLPADLTLCLVPQIINLNDKCPVVCGAGRDSSDGMIDLSSSGIPIQEVTYSIGKINSTSRIVYGVYLGDEVREYLVITVTGIAVVTNEVGPALARVISGNDDQRGIIAEHFEPYVKGACIDSYERDELLRREIENACAPPPHEQCYHCRVKDIPPTAAMAMMSLGMPGTVSRGIGPNQQ